MNAKTNITNRLTVENITTIYSGGSAHKNVMGFVMFLSAQAFPLLGHEYKKKSVSGRLIGTKLTVNTKQTMKKRNMVTI